MESVLNGIQCSIIVMNYYNNESKGIIGDVLDVLKTNYSMKKDHIHIAYCYVNSSNAFISIEFADGRELIVKRYTDNCLDLSLNFIYEDNVLKTILE